jgi:hypothetical protein
MIRTDRLQSVVMHGQQKCFAIESRPVIIRGKKVRHIVIFDNHPASLRLLLGSNLFPRPRGQRFYRVLTVMLVLSVVCELLWFLL